MFTPLFLSLKKMNEPQYIYEKYFSTLIIFLELGNSGVELIQSEIKSLMGINVFLSLDKFGI